MIDFKEFAGKRLDVLIFDEGLYIHVVGGCTKVYNDGAALELSCGSGVTNTGFMVIDQNQLDESWTVTLEPDCSRLPCVPRHCIKMSR